MFCCTGTTMSEMQGNRNLMKATFTVLINDNNMKYLGIFLNVKVMKAGRFSLDSTLFSTNAIRGAKIEPTYGKILFCKNYKKKPFSSFLRSRSVTRLIITSDTPSPKKKSANNMIVSSTVISLTHLWQMMSQTKKKQKQKS